MNIRALSTAAILTAVPIQALPTEELGTFLPEMHALISADGQPERTELTFHNTVGPAPGELPISTEVLGATLAIGALLAARAAIKERRLKRQK